MSEEEQQEVRGGIPEVSQARMMPVKELSPKTHTHTPFLCGIYCCPSKDPTR